MISIKHRNCIKVRTKLIAPSYSSFNFIWVYFFRKVKVFLNLNADKHFPSARRIDEKIICIYNNTKSRAFRHQQKPRYARLNILKNFRVRKKFHIFVFLKLKVASYRIINGLNGSKWHISDSVRGLWTLFGEKSRRYGEKSKFSKKIFWTISLRKVAYVLSWDIIYFCAKFQLLNVHRLWFYKGQTGRTKKTLRHIYKY